MDRLLRLLLSRQDAELPILLLPEHGKDMDFRSKQDCVDEEEKLCSGGDSTTIFVPRFANMRMVTRSNRKLKHKLPSENL